MFSVYVVYYCSIIMNNHVPVCNLKLLFRLFHIKSDSRFTEEVHGVIGVSHQREQIHYQSTPSLRSPDFRARVFKDYNRESSHFTSAKIHSEMIFSHGIADSIQIYIIHRICWLCAPVTVVQHPFICFFIQKHTNLLYSFQSIWLYQSIRPTCWIDSWISGTSKSKFKSIKILLTPTKSESFLLSSSHSIPSAWSHGHWPVWASNIVIVVTLWGLDWEI